MYKDKIKNKIWNFQHKINTIFFPLMSKIFYFFPIKKNRIVVSSYHGKGFSDNPKFIIEELLKKNKYLEVIWFVDKYLNEEDNLPPNIKKVQYYTMKSLYYLATACVWIDNCRKDYAPKKKKEQLYIQTWHGGIGFKNVEAKCKKDLSNFYLKHAILDAKMTDLMLSNSKKTSEIYREMFWYKGHILEAGLPRNDNFITNKNNSEEIKKKVKKDLMIEEDTKIILYAPTFRDQYNLKSYNLNLKKVCQTFSECFGGKWISVFRLHPNIKADYSNKNEFKESVDATKYLNSDFLLQAADVFISDFSSMVFDFVINKKLVLLYASDYEEYIATRGVWLKYDMTIFPYAFSNDEMIKKIKDINMENYIKDLEKMLSLFEIRETGKSAVSTAQIILKYLITFDLKKSLQMVSVEIDDKRHLLY